MSTHPLHQWIQEKFGYDADVVLDITDKLDVTGRLLDMAADEMEAAYYDKGDRQYNLLQETDERFRMMEGHNDGG